jgi:hypothetical protein
MFAVAQSGVGLHLKNDRGDIERGTLTSNISMSVGGPWNMLGVVEPDGGAHRIATSDNAGRNIWVTVELLGQVIGSPSAVWRIS